MSIRDLCVTAGVTACLLAMALWAARFEALLKRVTRDHDSPDIE